MLTSNQIPDIGDIELIFSPVAGKYLGSHLEFNKEVLLHFVRCHEFTQLLLVQALRQFLWSFRYVIGRKSWIEPILCQIYIDLKAVNPTLLLSTIRLNLFSILTRTHFNQIHLPDPEI